MKGQKKLRSQKYREKLDIVYIVTEKFVIVKIQKSPSALVREKAEKIVIAKIKRKTSRVYCRKQKNLEILKMQNLQSFIFRKARIR